MVFFTIFNTRKILRKKGAIYLLGIYLDRIQDKTSELVLTFMLLLGTYAQRVYTANYEFLNIK